MSPKFLIKEKRGHLWRFCVKVSTTSQICSDIYEAEQLFLGSLSDIDTLELFWFEHDTVSYFFLPQNLKVLHYELLCYLNFVNCNPNIPSVCAQCRVNQFCVESNPGGRQEAQFARSPPCCRTATPYLHCKSFYPASHPLCLAETKTLAFQKRYLCLFASLFSNCTKKPLLTGFVSKKPI